MHDYIAALLGGLLIGLSASLLLLFKGRIFGISGILGGVIKPRRGEIAWRLIILAGLLTGGWLAYRLFPQAFPDIAFTPLRLIIAGFLVGFGTQLGGGCTSGHGVCGISRLSVRSIVATVTFMVSGMITVFIMSRWGGGL